MPDGVFHGLADAETAAVALRLIEIERTAIGAIRAYAAVEIEVGGVVFIVQGLTVVETRRELRVDLGLARRPRPAHDGDGAWNRLYPDPPR